MVHSWQLTVSFAGGSAGCRGAQCAGPLERRWDFLGPNCTALLILFLARLFFLARFYTSKCFWFSCRDPAVNTISSQKPTVFSSVSRKKREGSLWMENLTEIALQVIFVLVFCYKYNGLSLSIDFGIHRHEVHDGRASEDLLHATGPGILTTGLTSTSPKLALWCRKSVIIHFCVTPGWGTCVQTCADHPMPPCDQEDG